MIHGETRVEGRAKGPILMLEAALSFWGGVDPATGTIIEKRHPQCGLSLGGTILALPSVKGSSSGASILAETLRNGTGPAAIILGLPDGILVTGALVAARLYDVHCPIVLVADFAAMAGFRGETEIMATDGGGATIRTLR